MFVFAFAGGFLGKRLDELLDAAGGDGIAGEEIPDFFGGGGEVFEVEFFVETDFRIVDMRLAADDEEFEFLEVGEDGEGEFFVPCVAFGLEGMAGVEFFGGFFGFADEAVTGVDAEEVVGAFLAASDLGAGFDFDFALRLDEAGFVGDVPAEGGEKGIEEVVAELGFDVAGRFMLGEVVAEGIDEAGEFGGEVVEGGVLG